MCKWMLALAAACVLGTAPAHAQTGSMKIVISFPPGGPVDFVARVLAEGLSNELTQTVVVDNRPGAIRSGSPAQAPWS